MSEAHRVVVVTGASRGIGAALAEGFAARGDIVRGCSRSGHAPDGSGVRVDAVDVTDERAVHDWVASLLDEHGRIDVLVNNAGVVDAEVPIEDSDPQEWWRTVEVDVLGPYLVTRMVLPGMLERGSGCVIALNSGAGTRAGQVATAYNVAKTALARITGSVAASGRGRGVVAFDLAPGVVRTDMTEAMAAHAERTEWTDPRVVVELAVALASGRLDAWSGRMVRAGADTPDSLARRAAAGLDDRARTISLVPYGDEDPLAP